MHLLKHIFWNCIVHGTCPYILCTCPVVLLYSCPTEPCPVGTYSSTGYNVDGCIMCPLHFYQDHPGQTVCRECPMDKQTLDTGSDNNIDCVDITEGKTGTPHVTRASHALLNARTITLNMKYWCYQKVPIIPLLHLSTILLFYNCIVYFSVDIRIKQTDNIHVCIVAEHR